MVTMGAWAIACLACLILSWRAMDRGRGAWPMIGLVAMIVFAAETWGSLRAAGALFFDEEYWWPPDAVMVSPWAIGLGILLLLRPPKTEPK